MNDYFACADNVPLIYVVVYIVCLKSILILIFLLVVVFLMFYAVDCLVGLYYFLIC